MLRKAAAKKKHNFAEKIRRSNRNEIIFQMRKKLVEGLTKSNFSKKQLKEEPDYILD